MAFLATKSNIWVKIPLKIRNELDGAMKSAPPPPTSPPKRFQNRKKPSLIGHFRYIRYGNCSLGLFKDSSPPPLFARVC